MADGIEGHVRCSQNEALLPQGVRIQSETPVKLQTHVQQPYSQAGGYERQIDCETDRQRTDRAKDIDGQKDMGIGDKADDRSRWYKIRLRTEACRQNPRKS